MQEHSVGFVNASEVQNGCGKATSLDWQSLGQLVQRKTLEAVSQHFFHLGVTDLCMDAIKSMEVRIDGNPPMSSLGRGGGRAELFHE